MDNFNSRKDFLNHLSNFVTEKRKSLIEEILDFRTRYLTVVLEDIYQSQNASAVLRTCECLGLQDVHIVEQENKFSVNRNIVKGASKWMDIYRYDKSDTNNIKYCITSLKEKGYKICATSPHEGAYELNEFEPDGKTAFLLGHEKHGLSDQAIEMADFSIKIPMYGFTESFNLSVSGALILYDCIQKLKNRKVDFYLSETEKEEIRYKWYKMSYSKSDLLEKEFFKT
ncbi:RNA methyltransferase [Mangrovivirga sp. M17]|uniref:tRNA (guanosine(18)-2'-O)-methyltransferase n=1 Tax=Mangrovivirga halotolerans TaxID=2993936 RepID=A0ABT3RRD7_9BACT|nr:RNA methyltransferase [Mangrovivirga halotolerans]MCX2744349.1 RNA methyltransferase [Mangrovivirga halotolerans]